MMEHLSLRLRIFLFFAFLAVATSGLAVAGIVLGFVQLGEAHALSAFVVAGFTAVIAIFALTTWVWVLFDENVAKPVERLAAELRARAHAGVAVDLDRDAAKHLGDLAPAATAVTESLTETRNAMAMAVGRETARMAAATARLEALLAEMPDGVLFCTADHVVTFYNGRVAEILGAPDALGLNRPLSGLLQMAPITQAYGRRFMQGQDVLLTTRAGARLLEARMRLVRLEGQETERSGYILTIRDVSGELPVRAERAHLFEELLKGARTGGLTALADDIAARKAATDTQWWPMETLGAVDIGDALKRRLARKGIEVTNDFGAAVVRCDGFAITLLLERLALEWANAGATDIYLSPHATARETGLQMSSDISVPEFDAWLNTPLSPGVSGFSGRDVLLCHGARLNVVATNSDETAFRLTFPAVEMPSARPVAQVCYDFDLLSAPVPDSMADAQLDALNYVVFDTETTGLNPAVDEICQIAAVRIAGGKIRARETFDMLVDPGRPIPAASTAVHHITDAMVAGAPGVEDALARFHTFAKGAVLVAHNAPFDMAFLRRREAAIGVRFDQPILDTVLCSAILFGQSAEHTLDALCTRLGVVIPEAARHTALGDALGTADAMARMIPMLAAADITRLDELISAFNRHKRLIEHLN